MDGIVPLFWSQSQTRPPVPYLKRCCQFLHLLRLKVITDLKSSLVFIKFSLLPWPNAISTERQRFVDPNAYQPLNLCLSFIISLRSNAQITNFPCHFHLLVCWLPLHSSLYVHVIIIAAIGSTKLSFFLLPKMIFSRAHTLGLRMAIKQMQRQCQCQNT